MDNTEQYPYSPGFQIRLAAALLQNATWYARYYGVWRAEYFTDPIVQLIMGTYFKFRTTEKQNPSKETLINAVILSVDNSSDEYKSKVVETINSLYSHEVVDADWTVNHVKNWAHDQAIEQAILNGADLLQTGRKAAIPKLIDEAYRVGQDLSKIGLFLNKNSKKPSQIIREQRLRKVPTGFTDLDPLIQGGVGGGELLVFLGPPKGFKSGNMLNATIPALCAPFGLNVTYCSFELSEAKVYERYCYRITRMDAQALEKNPELFDQKFEERVQQIICGQLNVRNWPTRTATIDDIRAYLDLLDAQGHSTQLLVVDYGNIMKVADRYASEWTGIGANFESIRAVGIERNIPTISAARTNREGLLTDDLRMEHIAGSMEIAATVDYLVALLQTDEEHKEWTMRQKLMLNRNEDCGVIVGCDIDYPTYTMHNTGIVNTQEDDEETEKGQGAVTKQKPINRGAPLKPEQAAKLKDILSRAKGAK